MNAKNVLKAVCYVCACIGCIGTIGIASFDMKDNLDEFRECFNNDSLDVTETPSLEVKEA